MSFVSNILSGGQGTGFQAQGAKLQNPVTEAQATGAYNTAQGQLGNIDPFIQALQAQNGIGNQSNVFNQQQQLAQQLGQQAQGQGPNPALAQLANSTGQNVGQQAALMAGQRGSGANVGLIARQAGQQGAGIQQNAAGQAAVLRAQQQLAAQQALQQQQVMLGNLATQQVGQQANAINMGNSAAQNEQNILLNGINNQNQANVSNQAGVNSVNGSIAAGNQKMQGQILGGALSGAAGATSFSGVGKYNGGVIGMDGGGQVPAGQALSSAINSHMPSLFQSSKPASNPEADRQAKYDAIRNQNHANVGYAQGGEIGPSSFAAKFLSNNPMDYRAGGILPGRAVVQGDSPKNDIVPIMGSPGEIMLPRHITQSDDAPEKAKQFVAALLAKQKRKK